MMESGKFWDILLVDDDEDDHVITREMLSEARGVRVRLTWACSFHEGREKLFGGSHFDAVLVDYDLGANTGLEIIREAVQSDYPAPLILLTGRGTYEVDLEAMEAGASVYLTKSEINPLLLERSIRYAIERKRTEDALRASEERYRRLVSVMPAAIYTCDSEGKLTFYNQQAADLWGRSPKIGDPYQRFCGSYCLYLMDGSRLPFEDTPMAAAIANGSSYRNQEVIVERPDGSRLIVSVNIDPLYSPSGQIIGAINVFLDVTTRVQAQNALRESEMSFRKLADAMPQLVWTANPDGEIDYYNNRRWEYYTSLTSDHLCPFTMLLAEEDLKSTAEAWLYAIKNRTVFEIEHRIRMADGSYRWHLTRAVPIHNEQGKVTRWYGTATDIDDQKHLIRESHSHALEKRFADRPAANL